MEQDSLTKRATSHRFTNRKSKAYSQIHKVNHLSALSAECDGEESKRVGVGGGVRWRGWRMGEGSEGRR